MILTDEDIDAVRELPGETLTEFARAIEAAVLKRLGEQEPVAWVCINEDGECEQIDFGSESPLPGDDGFKPLYEHPAPPKSEWQPITTAPKNEVEILVIAPIVGQMVVMFADGYWREKANYCGLKHAPTHWQHLPPPPEAK